MQKGRFLDTPLHAAAQKDCPDIIRLLLEFGANINARNLELQRPVETAPPSSTAESALLLYEGNAAQLILIAFGCFSSHEVQKHLFFKKIIGFMKGDLTGKREGMGSGQKNGIFD